MRKSPISDPIAQHEVLWIRDDGIEQIIVARLGRPYFVEDDLWACPVELQGVDGQYPDTLGVGSMHALTLSVRLLKTRLGDLIDSGQTLRFTSDRSAPWDRVALDAVFA